MGILVLLFCIRNNSSSKRQKGLGKGMNDRVQYERNDTAEQGYLGAAVDALAHVPQQ